MVLKTDFPCLVDGYKIFYKSIIPFILVCGWGCVQVCAHTRVRACVRVTSAYVSVCACFVVKFLLCVRHQLKNQKQKNKKQNNCLLLRHHLRIKISTFPDHCVRFLTMSILIFHLCDVFIFYLRLRSTRIFKDIFLTHVSSFLK